MKAIKNNSTDYESHYAKMEKDCNKWRTEHPDCSLDESKAHVLAMSYYTGAYSERVNRQTNVIIKTQNLLLGTNEVGLDTSVYSIIYFLVKALSKIEYYWGMCTRCINLTPEDFELYKKGNIITWLQFSSSSKGGTASSAYFTKRNSRFIVYSLTGRDISAYSPYKTCEREVLFLPFSHFVVYATETEWDHTHEKKITVIYMR